MDGLRKGILQKSKSPIAMGLFLVAKNNDEQRPVVDFRLVTEIFVNNRNPIP